MNDFRYMKEQGREKVPFFQAYADLPRRGFYFLEDYREIGEFALMTRGGEFIASRMRLADLMVLAYEKLGRRVAIAESLSEQEFAARDGLSCPTCLSRRIEVTDTCFVIMVANPPLGDGRESSTWYAHPRERCSDCGSDWETHLQDGVVTGFTPAWAHSAADHLDIMTNDEVDAFWAAMKANQY